VPLRIVNSDGSGEKGTAYLLPMVTLQELADRLERVETEVALHRLAADYCIGADQVDLARFTTIWTSDALWNAAGDDSDDDEYRLRGTDAITTALKGQWATLPRMPHATANHVVERDPENPGAASGRDVAVTVQLPDGRWVLGGVCEDRYERAGGEWRIAVRTVRRFFDLRSRPIMASPASRSPSSSCPHLHADGR